MMSKLVSIDSKPLLKALITLLPGICVASDLFLTLLIKEYFSENVSIIFCVSSVELSLTTTIYFGRKI